MRLGVERLESREVPVRIGRAHVSPAVFAVADTTTLGSWTTAYGADGYSMAQGAAAQTAYAQTNFSGTTNLTWAASTNDPRALQQPGAADRLAACWYGATFTIDVNLTDGRTHRAALYLLDWDGGNRSERIEVLDARNGRVLGSRIVSAFQGGQYLVWNISGHVQFRVTRLSGPNAVVSGLFFGGPPPAEPATATFTGGSANEGSTGQVGFTNQAGAPGSYVYSYDFNNDGTFEVVNAPAPTATVPASYLADGPGARVVRGRITNSSGGYSDYTTTVTVNNVPPAVSVLPATGATGAAVAFGATVTDPSPVDTAAGLAYAWTFGDGATSTLAAPSHAYAAPGSYTFTVTVKDKDGGTTTATGTALVAGPTSAAASFVRADTSTQGSWGAAYGADGYSLAQGAAALPGSVLANPSGQTNWTWAASTTDPRGLRIPGTADRLAACWTGASFTLDVNLTDGRVHQTALYLVDWDGGGTRSERIDVLDVATGQVLDSRTVSGFQDGLHLVWNLSGHVQFRITRLTGINAVVSGLFFGGPAYGAAVGDAILTPYDAIPNFGAHPTITAVRSGNWSDAGTWSLGRLPAANDVVAIGTGAVVTYDVVSDVQVKTVAVLSGGSLRFRTDVRTRLTVTNLAVLAGGELQIGTVNNPIVPTVQAEVIFPDQPFDLIADPGQWGHGLIALGKVTICGAAKANPFVRLAAEPLAGQTSLTLSQPATDWKVGDRMILPDTRQLDDATRGANYAPQWEALTIAAISPDGLQLTLTAPLQYSHPGARNATSGALDFLPHVDNMTRNVVIRSANPLGTRGHVVFTYRADVDVRYATFGGLGRTTLTDIRQPNFTADRNPVQFRHLYGPAATPAGGYQYTFLGNVVTCPLTPMTFVWGININDSDYGLIQDNILYNWAGASLITKTGAESYNVIARNSVVRTSGTAERVDDFAAAGTAFWLRGPNNYVRDNVAANINGAGGDFYSYGFNVYAPFLGTVTVPAYQGADPSQTGQSRAVDMNATPLLEFSGNEVYGASQNGLTVWWLGAFFETPKGGAGTVQDFRVWHHSGWGFFGYETNQLVIDGFTARGDANRLPNPYEQVTGMWFSDYMTRQLDVRNADIQGMAVGIMTPTNVGRGTDGDTSTIRDSYLANRVNVLVTPPRSVNGSGNLAPKAVVVRNVRFATPATVPASQGVNIAMDPVIADSLGASNFNVSDQVFVYDYNGVAGRNFQVFYTGAPDRTTLAQITGYVAQL